MIEPVMAAPKMQTEKIITIVSGLPRSGTSLMMKMLETGGMEVVIDNIRKSDEDNPRGYYEFEKVKKIKNDASWLDNTEGKVFKMVSMLLYDLPATRTYRVIFMRRRMEEILASQRTMLRRLGKEQDSAPDEKMRRLYTKHLQEMEQWLAGQQNMQVLYVSYNDVMERTRECSETVSRFLQNGLDTDKMASVVDASLYRQRECSRPVMLVNKNQEAGAGIRKREEYLCSKRTETAAASGS